MKMLVVQNRTDRQLKFQNKTIEPFGFAEYTELKDFIGLARLFNSGKVTYCNKKVTPVAPKEKEVVEVKVEEPVKVETVPEKVEEVVPEVVEQVEVEVQEVETITEEKPSKRTRKSKEDK